MALPHGAKGNCCGVGQSKWDFGRSPRATLSMFRWSPAVQQEPWCQDFDKNDLDASVWGLKEVQRRVEAGEPPDSYD